MHNHIKNGFIFTGFIGISLLYLFNIRIIYANPNTLTLPLPIILFGLIGAVIGIIL